MRVPKSLKLLNSAAKEFIHDLCIYGGMLMLVVDECPSIPATKLSGSPAALNLEAKVALRS